VPPFTRLEALRMPTPSRSFGLLALGLAALLGLSGSMGCDFGGSHPSLRFTSPETGTLTGAGDAMEVELSLPSELVPGSLELFLDGVKIPANVESEKATASLPDVAAGHHVLFAWARVPVLMGRRQRLLRTVATFDAMVVPPAGCEELNAVECLLPYPSSRFLEPVPGTPPRFRLNIPAAGMPEQSSPGVGVHQLSPEPYKVLDGFSPTVQVLMNFPGGVDLAVSDASRLLVDRRGPDARSLDADSPTLLLDVDTGERILHWLENDSRADDPERVVTFLRPGKSLTPGHRYIVAIRNLRREDGSAVPPEPAFRALRDGSPITIPGLAERKPAFEDIFAELAQAGVPRTDLILAFDFRTQTDHGLTFQMLSMRDQAFAWLESLPADAIPFSVDEIKLKDDCSAGGALHSEVLGTFDVPLFLGLDPVTQSNALTYLNVDSEGTPTWDGQTFTHPPFTLTVPCSAVAADGAQPAPGVVIGHGLFGTGRGFVEDLVKANVFQDVSFAAGATDWRGLSKGDIDPLATSFVVNHVLLNFDHFAALPDRLRQGQLNTLVLARMMRTGIFNRHPAFQSPSGQGAISSGSLSYLGGSLGGIMGTMFAALSPDATNLNLIVPGINFSCLLQRATPFLLFQDLLQLTGLSDPMKVALGLGLSHELWVRGEPAGYATHITSNPLPGTNTKNIMLSQAFLDQQVSNQCTEIEARTLGIPNLVGSHRSGMPQIPDLPGPLASAYVEYDTGSFDLNNPEHAPFIPPLENLQAESNGCDPHGRQAFIPAALAQVKTFFQGGGILNYCTGPGNVCDTVESPGAFSELPYGEPACDPLQ
jgi:hypothetical protein